MKRQLGPILAALTLLCVPLAWSQTSTTDSTVSTSSDPLQQSGSTDSSSSQTSSDDDSSQSQQQQSTAGPQDTFTHPEQLPPLSTLSELAARTGIVFNVQAGTLQNYDTNNAYRNSSYWETYGLFGGGVRITQIRPTLYWNIGYVGGISLISYSTNVPNYQSLGQNANATIRWAITPHWQLRIKDQYLYTADPFAPYFNEQTEPTYNNPNPQIYVPQAITETNFGTIDLVYRMTEHDSIDFQGAESFQHFIRDYAGFQNSFTYSGGAFYQHTFSSRFSAGGGYNFTALDYGHGSSRSGINMIEGFVAYAVNPHMTVTGWAGPQFTTIKDEVPIFCLPYGCLYEIQHTSDTNVAEGGTFAWTGTRNIVRAKFSHRITNGGGLLGTSRLYQGDVSYLRPLHSGWNFRIGAAYNNTLSISPFSPSEYLKSIEGAVGFSRKFSDAWNANVYYALIRQQENFFSTPSTVLTNGVGVTIRYSWGYSLGR